MTRAGQANRPEPFRVKVAADAVRSIGGGVQRGPGPRVVADEVGGSPLSHGTHAPPFSGLEESTGGDAGHVWPSDVMKEMALRLLKAPDAVASIPVGESPWAELHSSEAD